jgi:CrcB protein
VSARVSWRLAGAVAAGGALGSAARYGLAQAWPTPAQSFPWATFVTNVVGCLAIGVLLGVHRSPVVRAFVGTGLLGGFTTFSTYAAESEALRRAGQPLLAAGYALGTVLTALGAAWLGATLVRRRA